MKLTFVNGTALQQGACANVAHSLLNYPFDSIPMILTVEFVADPAPGLHNEFAFTEYTYGSQAAITRIASIAPNWGHPYDDIRFLQETFAHEMGHVAFAALPEALRVKVAQMFGATSDDLAELQPPGSDWEDRIIETIAETYKDAFVPKHLRLFPNRTSHHLSYTKFPEFRQIFRSGFNAFPSYDAMLIGTTGLTEALGKAHIRDGLFEDKLPLSDEAWSSEARAAWPGLLHEPINAASPIITPDLSIIVPTEPPEREFVDGEPPGINVITDQVFSGLVEVLVTDDNADPWALQSHLEVILTHQFFGAEPWKWWLTLKRKTAFGVEETLHGSIAIAASLGDFGLSGLEILQTWEGLGESPVYDPTPGVKYNFFARGTSFYGNTFRPATDYEPYLLGRMQSLFAIPHWEEAIEPEPVPRVPGSIDAGPDEGGRILIPHQVRG